MMKRLFALLALVALLSISLAPRPASAIELPWSCLKLIALGGYHHPGMVTACAMEFALMWDEWDQWPGWPDH